MVGTSDGSIVVGKKLGSTDGVVLGASVGETLGDRVGSCVGIMLGSNEGGTVGATLGDKLGGIEGACDGEIVGRLESYGAALEGASVGANDGPSDGAKVGTLVVLRGGGSDGTAVLGGVVGIQVGLYEGRLVDGSEVGAFVGIELEGEAVLGVTVLGAEVLHCIAPHVNKAKPQGMKTRKTQRTWHTMGWQQMASACSAPKLGCKDRRYHLVLIGIKAYEHTNITVLQCTRL